LEKPALKEQLHKLWDSFANSLLDCYLYFQFLFHKSTFPQLLLVWLVFQDQTYTICGACVYVLHVLTDYSKVK